MGAVISCNAKTSGLTWRMRSRILPMRLAGESAYSPRPSTFKVTMLSASASTPAMETVSPCVSSLPVPAMARKPSTSKYRCPSLAQGAITCNAQSPASRRMSRSIPSTSLSRNRLLRPHFGLAPSMLFVCIQPSPDGSGCNTVQCCLFQFTNAAASCLPCKMCHGILAAST